MSVYVSKRNESKVQFLETARKLSAHTSQIYTSISINKLDHYIKDVLRIKSYARYVDDFYFFVETKEQAQIWLDKIRIKIKELGLNLNESKTKIQKFKNGFKFLKMKFICTETGKIIRKMDAYFKINFFLHQTY